MLRCCVLCCLFLTLGPLARAANEVPVEQQARVCFACHGPKGASTQPLYPILAGQTFLYIYNQLKDFKAGRRKDPQMSPMAANLSRAQMKALAGYFTKQKWPYNSFTPDQAKAASGKRIADAALCTMCHLGNYQGQNEIPRLAGQHYAYLKKQLTAFRDKTRTNDAGNMTSVSNNLSDAQIDELANYLAGLSIGH